MSNYRQNTLTLATEQQWWDPGKWQQQLDIKPFIWSKGHACKRPSQGWVIKATCAGQRTWSSRLPPPAWLSSAAAPSSLLETCLSPPPMCKLTVLPEKHKPVSGVLKYSHSCGVKVTSVVCFYLFLQLLNDAVPLRRFLEKLLLGLVQHGFGLDLLFHVLAGWQQRKLWTGETLLSNKGSSWKWSLKPVYPVVLPSTVQQVLLQFMVELLAGFHLLDTRLHTLFTLAGWISQSHITL